MKRAILAFAVIMGLNAPLLAQSLRIENVSPSLLSGIKTSEDEQMFCNVYADNNGGENKVLNVVAYNNQLMEMRKAEIEISNTSVLLTSCFSGEVTVILLGDPAKKTRTAITVDREGNIMQKKEEENVPAALLQPENYISLQAIMPSEFVMVMKTAAKNNEYEIERFNMALDPGNKITVKGGKGKMIIKQVETLNDICYLLCKETIGLNNEKTEYKVLAANLASGKIIYTRLFGEDAQIGVPVQMRVNEDMTVTLAGLMFNEGDMDKIPDGFMWTKIDDKGELVKYTQKPWQEMLDRNDNKIIKDISEGRQNVLIEDIFKMPGSESTVLLGELFEKTNGGAGTASFAVKDFMMFKFDGEGQLLSAEKIKKTPKLATVRGTGATGGKYLLAEKLYDHDFFTYRTYFQDGERVNLMYRYNNGKADFVNVLPVTDSLVDKKGLFNISLNEEEQAEVPQNGKQSKKSPEKNIPVVTQEVNLDEMDDAEKHYPLILLKENHAVVQKYDNDVFTARMVEMPTR